MARRPDRLLDNLRRALDEVPLSTPLGQWMIAHRAELEALLRDGEPDWAKMAAEFGRAGLRDETGQKPTPGTAENTWRVVCATERTRQGTRAIPEAVRQQRRE